MKTIREGKVLFVKVPEDASELQVGHFTHHLMYCDKTGFSKSVILPEGNWTILGKAFELMEEQKEKCLEIHIYWPGPPAIKMYRNYLHPDVVYDFFDINESYNSIIENHGITKDYIVITDK